MAYKIAPEEQQAIATARFIRMSPTKVRQVVNLIRGRHVEDARRVLTFSERGASEPVLKVLNSAIANAENNRGLPGDELIVARAWVDEGPTLKRFRPRALGRATRVRKRTCHISVVVGRDERLLEGLTAPAGKTEEKPKRKTTARKKDADAQPKTTRKRSTTAKKTSDEAPKAEAKSPKKETTENGGEE